MAGVTLKGVRKEFDGVAVIPGLDLEVRDHEFLALVGPSGCGKSTVLRMIAGLEDVTAGSIAIGPRVVNDLPAKDRDIAMVFQSYALYPHMNVRDNLEFGLKIRKTPRAERERLVARAAELLDIADLLERTPRELSGGQRQRVAVGRAIVRQPAVFLFDEPLSNLDAKLRVQMRAEIARLQQRLATTTVYVTHDQVEAMTMGQRVAVMRGGELQQVGTPMELYERPANVFVASFIGTPPMNFLPGTVEDGGGSLALPGGALALPAARRPLAAGHAGRRVVVGVRPEGIREADTPPDPAAAVVPASVELAEPLGNEVIVHLRAGDTRLVARFSPQRIPEPGERMRLVIDPRAVHLFDAETERRIA